MISTSTRRRLYGSIAFVTSAIGFAQGAQAQDECGVIPPGGSVTCTSAGNPYADGIFYVAFGDATINLNSDVSVVDNSATDNAGLFAIIGDNGMLTINGAPGSSITTIGNNAVGVQAFTNAGDLNVTLNNVSTTGTGGGIQSGASDGNVSVTANTVSTLGVGADAVEATTNNSDVTIDVGTVTTAGAGANGVRARSDFGDVSVTADNITTTGNQSGFIDPGANGVLAQTSGAGTLTVDAGTITTSGIGAIGIRASNNTGAMTIDADTINTTGNAAEGISVVSAGAVDIGAGTVTTAGIGANGIQAQSTGSVLVDFDSVTTTGDNSVGVLVPQGALFFGPRFTPNVTITGGDVTTSGLNSDGVRAIASTGTSSVTLDGTVTTTGDNSRGIAATGTTAVAVTGPFTVSTAGLNATGVLATSTGTIDVDNLSGSITTTGNTSNGVTAAGTVGPVTIDTGMVDVSGTGSVGINSTTTTGAQLITASGTVGSDNGNAIVATSTTGNIGVTTDADVSAGGTGLTITTDSGTQTLDLNGSLTAAGNALVLNSTSGALTGDISGDVTSNGGTAILANTGTGSQMLTVAGNVVAAADAVVLTTTDGDIDTTVDGDVTSTTGTAVTATSTTGNIDLGTTGTVDGALSGISATSSGGGDVMVTNTGPVIAAGGDGILASSVGGMATVNANGDVTGTTTGVTALGDDVTVNVGTGATVSGPVAVQASGLMSNTLTINGTVDGATAINADNGATTLNIGTNGVITGLVDLTDNNDILNNGGTLALNGISFGLGNDTLNNSGTLDLTTGATVAGLEVLNSSGTVNASGTTTFTTPVSFTNSGTFNTTGGITLVGVSDFTNDATLNVDAGVSTFTTGVMTNTGMINAVSGASTITGQTSFANSGTLNLVDDATDDVLTIDSDYAGSGGATLAVDASDSMADMLVVTGDISGSTAVDANILGTGALVNGGVQVVTGLGASTANAFTIGDVMGGSALVDYAIVQDGSDYYLDAALSPAGFRPLTLAAAAPDFWYPSADEIIANLAVPYKGGSGVGFWADGYISREKFGERENDYSFGGVDYTVDQRVKLGHMGLQGGVDFGMGETGRVGVTAGYSRHNGRGSTELDARGWNVGAYGAFGGVSGFHGEALVKYDRYKVDFDDGIFDAAKPKVKAFGVDGSIGYRLPMGGENSSLDFTAGLSHVTSKIDDIDVAGLNYDYDRVKSTRGRASARYNLGGDIQPYVQATAYHEFADAGGVALFDGVNTYDLSNAKRGTWGRLEAGIGGSPNRFPSFGAWADFGDVKGIGARLGMRFGASAEMAPPPPMVAPAPAPEPAPATQTCYDGSVILATDSCPLPPPPPPPAAMPERG